jgi:hypothetical protein
MAEFLLICTPAKYKLLPLPNSGLILGPIAVMFEKTADVIDVFALPAGSLSDSKASD